MPHVWALIRAIGSFNRMKDKRDMDGKTVVSVILDSDSDSDWNESDEEKEEGSFRVDKLTME